MVRLTAGWSATCASAAWSKIRQAKKYGTCWTTAILPIASNSLRQRAETNKLEAGGMNRFPWAMDGGSKVFDGDSIIKLRLSRSQQDKVEARSIQQKKAKDKETSRAFPDGVSHVRRISQKKTPKVIFSCNVSSFLAFSTSSDACDGGIRTT